LVNGYEDKFVNSLFIVCVHLLEEHNAILSLGSFSFTSHLIHFLFIFYFNIFHNQLSVLSTGFIAVIFSVFIKIRDMLISEKMNKS
jgi:hypothetical protein